MRHIPSLAVLAVLLLPGMAGTRCGAATTDGVALAVVYDTSGSMRDPVPDGTGKRSPKYLIANRALEAIARRIGRFAGGPGGTRAVEAGLFVFSDRGARLAVPFGPFKAEDFQAWARRFDRPQGGTPLGAAIADAGRAVLASNLSRKHVLVISDGESNIGLDPAGAMAELKRQADRQQTTLALHFVAFDVDAKVFEAVKKLGATVVGAANETQLNTQLEFILEKKILLEDEEPPTKK
jgi:hypothetical protein